MFEVSSIPLGCVVVLGWEIQATEAAPGAPIAVPSDSSA